MDFHSICAISKFIVWSLIGRSFSMTSSITGQPMETMCTLISYEIVQGQVAKSTHAGIPWLRYLRRQLGERVHFWPFDCWAIPLGRCVIAEVYPSLWSRGFPREDRTPDQHDAYAVSEWMRHADREMHLQKWFEPDLNPAERTVAGVEG